MKLRFTAILLCLPAAAQTISITSPAADAKVSGTISLAVSVSGITGLSHVRYMLNGKRMADYRNHELQDVTATSPYTYSWPTGNVWDGEATVSAQALDSNGTVLATSAEVPITIQNGAKTTTLTTPARGATVSGIINVTVHTNIVNVDGVQFAVDGIRQENQFGAGNPGFVNKTFRLDTRRFPNGQHEIYVGVRAAAQDVLNPTVPAGQGQVMVTFENGKAWMELRPHYRDVFLIPGETVSLAPKVLYTDGTSSAAPTPAFSTSAAGIATVNASTGLVTGTAPGVATITVTSAGKTATARAVVLSKKAFPHFGKDGAFLQSYDPAKSVFVRSLFVLDYTSLRDTPGLGAAMQAAAVNTFEGGIYLAPADAGGGKSLATYKSHFDPYFAAIMEEAHKYDMSVLMSGDNCCRAPESLHRVLTEAWASDALKYSFHVAGASGRVVGVEMIDESTGSWGLTPKPAVNWVKDCGVYKRCTIPKEAFRTIVGMLNTVSPRPMISWPILWLTGAKSAANWMGDPAIADYGSHYWDVNDWGRLYARGSSLPQYKILGMDNVAIGYYPGLQREKPIIMTVSINGAYYTRVKGAAGAYHPGQDRLQDVGQWAESQTGQMMYTVIMGMAGLRGYQYDFQHWKDERGASAVNQKNLQTGTDPFTIGPKRWAALSTTFNFIKSMERYILQPQMHALDLGSTIVTGARHGANGTVFMALSFNEQATHHVIDLSPYTSGATPGTRYRLLGSSLSSSSFSGTSDTVDLQPSETLFYLFPPEAAGSVALRIR